jgi:indolepyruvate ferredoxin oxidoreductase, alpha subunit
MQKEPGDPWRNLNGVLNDLFHVIVGGIRLAGTVLLSGNEAIARGAYEAGAHLIAGYPGTPSTEIIETAAQFQEVYSEWSPNEKVAVEVAIGAALSGGWAMATMKHVGLNVAADPLMTVSYMRIKGALVIVSADDPGMWSSQNEQDNRTYARFAKIPMYEPSDSQEAKDMTIAAFRLSHDFEVPVLLRTTTALAHTRCPVTLGERTMVDNSPPLGEKVTFNPMETVMIPGWAKLRHPKVEARLKDLVSCSVESPFNRIENDGNKGPAFITSGVPYEYVKDAFPDAPVLKLGFSYPLPVPLVEAFVEKHSPTYVIEELDPLMETELRARGINVRGKEMLTMLGEYSVSMLKEAFGGIKDEVPVAALGLPPRPPLLCAGCPHRGLFWALAGRKSLVFGDIGCYTLSVMKPLEATHAVACMGASISMAHGLEKALGREHSRNVVGVIGDSTFFHSGMTALLNLTYNRGMSKIVIADNSTTAMTGHQGNPGSGLNSHGQASPTVEIENVVHALGIKNVEVVDPYHLKETKAKIDAMMALDEPGVIISRRPCALLRSVKRGTPPDTVADKCKKCGLCHKLGCPGLGKDALGKTRIDANLCNGCTMCVQVCPFGAITEVTSK